MREANFDMEKNKKIIKKIIVILIIIVALIIGVSIWYVNDYYRSEVTVLEYQQKGGTVQISEIGDGLFLDGAGTENALIFYPGAKVEYISYLPLFYQLAEQGVDCFLLEMPGNLAILGMNKADAILGEYDYENWYMAGHSLGGAMAASYSAKHLEQLDGLVLLAAYPTVSLKRDGFNVLSLYGSEDMVVNREKLTEGRAFMPKDYTEICIEGGNHAWFGNYGEQKGDGKALISKEEQQRQTVAAILDMVDKQE